MMYQLDVFAQRPYQTADQWACDNRIMPLTNRLFSYTETPYLEEPTKAFCNLAENFKIVVSACSQLGKSTMIENCLGWIALFHARNTLVIFDTKLNSQQFSKTRLRPYLRDCVHLAAFDDTTAENRRNDKYKDVSHYTLAPGASLMLGGSTSASDLCSRPVAFLICDELDRFVDNLAGEGDPVLLAEKRQMRFRDSMSLFCSTPTTPQNRITKQYELGTMEEWGCICRKCGHWFPVRYKDICFDCDIPYITCSCGEKYCEKEIISLKHCYSAPQNGAPTHDRFGRIARSFKVTAPLVHSFYSWDYLRTEERNARRLGESAVQTWQNTTIGEPYIPPQERRVDPGVFGERLCDYAPDALPSWVYRVVGGADTQDNAIFLELIGISEDGQKVCGIVYRIFTGDPGLPDVWKTYMDFINTFQMKTTDGRLLKTTCVMQDSGGHYTQTVYSMSVCNPRIRPCKGRCYTTDGTKEERAILDRITTRPCYMGSTKTKIPLVHVGTVYAKDIILARANEVIYSEDYEKERWIWPCGINSGYDYAYFESLLSNTCIYTEKGHRYSLVEGMHDEALDCRVYALAAYELLKMYSGKIPAVEVAKARKPQTEITDTREIKESPRETVQTETPQEMPKPIYKPKKRYKSL